MSRLSLNDLPPLLRETIQKIVQLDADRQRMEFEQTASEEEWTELEGVTFTLVANIARAVEAELTDVTGLPWKGTPLL